MCASPVPDGYLPCLEFIASQQQHMMQLTYDWSAINSGSYHVAGLEKMASVLADNFSWLGGVMETIALPSFSKLSDSGEMAEIPLGKVLSVRKRPDAPLKVLLVGHMDTVFSQEDPFQKPEFIDQQTLRGPGVADMKGGLVVMLKALEALEKSPWADNLGWEVLITPDEEIGSPGSASLLAEAAARHQLGLVYEPSLPDGTLVAGRKGSGNFYVLVRGQAAHAGREFEKGRNAVALLAEITAALHALNGRKAGVTLNCARIRGGEALNVVPDTATLGFNVRMQMMEDQAWLKEQIEATLAPFRSRNGFAVSLHGGFTRPPKQASHAIARMQEMLASCGEMLGIPLSWQDTGGCCDGNNLAAAGLPNIDTLGVRGGNIHSDQEYVLLDSLVERAQLTALLLMRLASGDIAAPIR